MFQVGLLEKTRKTDCAISIRRGIQSVSLRFYEKNAHRWSWNRVIPRHVRDELAVPDGRRHHGCGPDTDFVLLHSEVLRARHSDDGFQMMRGTCTSASLHLCTSAPLPTKWLNEEDINVYPNPTKGRIFIDIGDEEIVAIKVFNSLGEIISFVIGVILFLTKFYAYRITHSHAILSDALESIVNIVTALVAIIIIYISSKPADSDHPYGHGKVEFYLCPHAG